jgi:membrane-bound lytic murein transglycosylase D
MRLLSIVLSLFLLSFVVSFAQTKEKPKQIKLFPDAYSELDDVPVSSKIEDSFIMKTLERARIKYLKALSFVEKGDTTQAASLFEESIDILNTIVNYPNILSYDDYTELVRSILEDYEKYVRNIDALDESSSFFLMRESLNKELEQTIKGKKVSIGPLTIKDTAKVKIGKLQNETSYIIPMDDNEYVQKSIEFLTQKPIGRKFVKGSLERSSSWGKIVKQIIQEEEMPSEIYYLAMVESGFNPFAVSRAKAVGMWQFISSTGQLYGLNSNTSAWIDERRDPIKATRAAMRHLRDLFNELGDWHLAIAAYNCGINAVQRAISRLEATDTVNFWNIIQYLPRETRNYVPLFIATVKVVSNPEAYGFLASEYKFEDEIVFDKYVLKEPVSLTAIAKCAGTSLENIKRLNPELLTNFTPPDIPEYEIRIPLGSKNTFIANYLNLSPEEKRPFMEYKVGRKETVKSVAEKFNINVGDILIANNIASSSGTLKKGTVIKIPIVPQSNTNSNELSTSTQSVQPDSSPKKLSNNEPYNVHTIGSGETLQSICQLYNTSEYVLKNLNPDIDFRTLQEGISIKVPKNVSKPDASKSNVAVASGSRMVVRHIVKSDETLFKIATEYNVSVDSIMGWNNLKSYTVFDGQSLKVLVPAEFKLKPKGEITPSYKYSSQDEIQEPTTKIQTKVKEIKIRHKVKRGETLASIADKYNVAIDALIAWNPKFKKKKNQILVGDIVNVYVKKSIVVGNSKNLSKDNVKPKVHIVRKGDTLSSIAQKYGIPVQNLLRSNPNIRPDKIQVGQKVFLE